MKFFGMKFSDVFNDHDIFHDDLRKSAYTVNPTIIPDIDLVVVLSGRTTVLGVDADGLQRPFDPSDDIERLKEGIQIARAVNALRANKKEDALVARDFVTPIFYNGRTIHNQHLRKALEQGIIQYPKELFIIRDIFPENTIGQVQSFKNYIREHHQHKNIAVVSSAYHLARVARTIGQDSPQVIYEEEGDHPMSQLNLFLYGVHKHEKRLGMVEDLQGEYHAMQRYSSGIAPSISRVQSKNVFFTDEDFHGGLAFNRALFWAQRGCLKTPSSLLHYFDEYVKEEAPFMHYQLKEWLNTRSLRGLRVLHHVPVVTNTLLKIACLIEAGAIVTVTNPSFMQPAAVAIESLHTAGIRYVADFDEIKDEPFDLYFDCGAELYQALGAPRMGAIELTASGDQFYRQQTLDFPVVSIDSTWTKQLETVFGCAESSHTAIAQLTGQNPAEKTWVIFGFGKIGRGLAYFCSQHDTPITIVDISETQRAAAQKLGLKAIDPQNNLALQHALAGADIVVTATGGKAVLDAYPYEWFKGKVLANMGIYDEYGSHFTEDEVLNRKAPVNFILKDPTPMKYIDPEFYIHNIAASFFRENLTAGVHALPEEVDQTILKRWCDYHAFPFDIIQQWFYVPESMAETKEETGFSLTVS